MKLVCVADEHTVRGFRLAGIEGHAVRTPQHAREVLIEVAQSPSIALIVLTDQLAASIPDLVARLADRDQPVIVVIPGPQGPAPGSRGVRELVQRAVGTTAGSDWP